jgi:hypothetical protein
VCKNARVNTGRKEGEWPKAVAGVKVTKRKGQDIRDVFEGHTTEGRRGNRGRGGLFCVVFILVVDDVEMDRFERYFSVPEQNFGVRVCHGGYIRRRNRALGNQI